MLTGKNTYALIVETLNFIKLYEVKLNNCHIKLIIAIFIKIGETKSFKCNKLSKYSLYTNFKKVILIKTLEFVMSCDGTINENTYRLLQIYI